MSSGLDLDIDLDEGDYPFEQALASSPYSLSLWLQYLESKPLHSPYNTSTNGDDDKRGGKSVALSLSKQRRQRYVLYERAIRMLPCSYKLWVDYLNDRT